MEKTTDNYTISQVCKILGRHPFYIKTIQSNLKLPAPKHGFSKSYVQILQNVIMMRLLEISWDDIQNLLYKEKRILEILKMDTTHNYSTWYLDLYNKYDKERCLLITGVDIGFDLHGNGIQYHLDFGSDKELFKGKEMGEDIQQALKAYVKEFDRMMEHLSREREILFSAVKWCDSLIDHEK